MTTPVRLQRSRQPDEHLVSPNGLPNIYVGRPTRWGNPFTLELFHAGWVGDTLDARRACVAAYRAWLVRDYHFMHYPTMPEAPVDFNTLADHNLVCWCPLDRPCHADVLLEFAALTTDEALHEAINREHADFERAYHSLRYYCEWSPDTDKAHQYASQVNAALDRLDDYEALARRRGMSLDDPARRTLGDNQIVVKGERA